MVRCFHFSRAMASSAFFFDDFTGAITLRTYAAIHDAAECRILYNFLLTTAVTAAASFWLRSWLRTRPVTRIAIFSTRNMNIGFFTENRFLKLNRHRVLQIISALWRIRITTVSTASTAKEHIEDIAKAATEILAASHPWFGST